MLLVIFTVAVKLAYPEAYGNEVRWGMGEERLGEAALENKMKNIHLLLSHSSLQGPFKDICVNPHNNSAREN